MTEKLTARDRFRAVFRHDTSELDRLPMLSLGTPGQGLFYQEWVENVATEDLEDEYVRITHFGDKTMNKWINNYAYRINIGAGTFTLGIILALFIAIVSVSYRSYKAAIANPVNSLRNE